MVQDERAELRTVVRDFFESAWSRDQLRESLDGKGLDTGVLWGRFAGELGLAGLLIPEELGGAGGSVADAAVVLEELGRSLAPVPFLSNSVVAAGALVAAGAEGGLLAGIADGTKIAVMAGVWAGPEAPLSATVTGDGVRLTGELPVVPDAEGADLILLPATVNGVIALVSVDARGAGVSVESVNSLDASVPLGTVRFDNAAGTVVAGTAEHVVRRGLALARLGVAATLLGVARFSLEQTVQHAKERTQFGRTIGSYQAIKHRLADMMVDVETLASAVSSAVVAVDGDDFDTAADLALAWAADKARKLVDEMIQLHGGMGYTWEHDAHLYYRRVFAVSGLLDAGNAALDRAWGAIGSGGALATSADDDSADETSDDVVRIVKEFVAEQWQPDLTVREWWRRMAAARLNLPSLPAELGGRGWTSADEGVITDTMNAAGVTLGAGGIGRALAAPTIAAAGTDAQKARFLPGILEGTEAWCQLFSEPDAGSDLAGLRTRAERDGDGWRITGQKTWTSNAHVADYAILLARTDSGVPKHQGITYFLFPMRQEGVDVRPIREMNGHLMFNDVFLDGAYVSDDCRLGELGQGWALANVTLSVERSSIAASPTMTPAMPGILAGHLDRPAAEFVEAFDPHSLGVVTDETVARLVRLATDRGVSDVAIRRDLVRLAHMSVLRVEGMRRLKGGLDVTGAEPNIGKIHSNTALRLARDLIARILGVATGTTPVTADEAWAREILLYEPAPFIYGGTDEIQRNIIAERALGLPRELDPSRSVAFRDIASAVRP